MAKFIVMFTIRLLLRFTGLILGALIMAVLGRGRTSRRTRQGVNMMRRFSPF